MARWAWTIVSTVICMPKSIEYKLEKQLHILNQFSDFIVT